MSPTSACVQAARSSGLSCIADLLGPFEVDRAPQIYMTVDLSIEKFSRQQRLLITWWYGADLFSEEERLVSHR